MSRYEHLMGRACHFLNFGLLDFDEDLDFKDFVISSDTIRSPGFKLGWFNNLVVAGLFQISIRGMTGREPTASPKYFPPSIYLYGFLRSQCPQSLKYLRTHTALQHLAMPLKASCSEDSH